MPTRLKWVRRGGIDIMVDHRESAPGSRTPTLCGWDGGWEIKRDPAVKAQKCPDCAAIYRWAGGR